MASCKDCICEQVCKYNDGVNLWCKGDCPRFKDRSRFVELPCKAGDIIYEICERRKSGEWKKIIVERVVYGINVGADNSMVARCGTTISVFLSGIGKTVFLTREEAEKALEERENNG